MAKRRRNRQVAINSLKETRVSELQAQIEQLRAEIEQNAQESEQEKNALISGFLRKEEAFKQEIAAKELVLSEFKVEAPQQPEDSGSLKKVTVVKEQQIQEQPEYINQIRSLCDARLAEIDNLKKHTGAIELQLKDQQEYIQKVVELCDNRQNQIEVKDQTLAQLSDLAEDRHRQILHLNAHIAEQAEHLKQLRNKKSWRYTRPLRQLGGFLNKKIIRKTDVKLTPFNQVEVSGSGWHSVGEDPYFLLKPKSKHLLNCGWVWLNYHFVSEKAAEQEIFFDLGNGFAPELCLKFQAKQGANKLPLYLPENLKALRFDPQTGSGHFELHSFTLEKATKPLNETGINEYLQKQEGFEWQLQPVHQVEADLEKQGWWHSTGNDPHFMLQGPLPDAGWYMVEMQINTESDQENARFYFDFGDGLNECDSFNLPVKSENISKRVCHFREAPKAIRFDPQEREGQFSLQHLKFIKLTERSASSEMLETINLVHEEFQDQGLKSIQNTLEQRANQQKKAASDLLLEFYGHCFKVDQGQVLYSDWIKNVEAPRFKDRSAIEAEIQAFERKPVISVVMPTYNTDERLLRACIDSIMNQSYPHWEFCIADDNSPDARVREVLSEYAEKDCRIKTVFRKENGHISKATNSALEIVKGDFVALLDHDDELSKDALYCVAKALNDNPDAKIIYSDEDKIDENGRRYEPHFKCDWNRDLLYSQNYISHLGVYNAALLKEIGGFRTGVEGSQDYDLLLRAVAKIDDSQIVHIPHVLYHWRAIEGSTALEAGEKSYTTEAGIKALENYFAEAGQDVSVEEGIVANTYRIRWPIPEEQPLVSLLIPTRDGYDILKQCVDSILEKTTYKNYEIIILDNQTSCEKTLDYFQSFENHDKVRVLPYDQPFNYSAINNYGVEHAKGSIIGLINNDIEVISPEWLTEMVSHSYS